VRPRVYVETSVVSYLTALPTRDLVRAAHQQITSEWWAARDTFDLFVSDAVLEEMRGGDATAAARRLSAAEGIPVLVTSPDAQALAKTLLRAAALPSKAAIDAIHVAVATVSAMDFLLTWNCTHIANAVTRPRIEAVCRLNGFEPPTICTPEELRMKEET
jgi:CheY-like chemotaxis protein